MEKHHNKDAYIFVSPLAFITIVLIYVPIAVTFYYSFINLELTKPKPRAFVGLANYLNLVTDKLVIRGLINSLFIMCAILIMTIILGLAFALILKIDTPINGFLTAVAIVPWAMPPIVSGIVWRWMFHPNFGLINSIAMRLGFISEPVQWFLNPVYILLIVSISGAWRAIPLGAVTFLAALQCIPVHLYESAEIDGCGKIKGFFHITLPLLRPSLSIVITTTSITAINVFDEVVSLMGFSNVNSTLMMEIYLRTFKFMRFSEGSALTWMVMIFAGILGIFYVRRIYRKVGYL